MRLHSLSNDYHNDTSLAACYILRIIPLNRSYCVLICENDLFSRFSVLFVLTRNILYCRHPVDTVKIYIYARTQGEKERKLVRLIIFFFFRRGRRGRFVRLISRSMHNASLMTYPAAPKIEYRLFERTARDNAPRPAPHATAPRCTLFV